MPESRKPTVDVTLSATIFLDGEPVLTRSIVVAPDIRVQLLRDAADFLAREIDKASKDPTYTGPKPDTQATLRDLFGRN